MKRRRAEQLPYFILDPLYIRQQFLCRHQAMFFFLHNIFNIPTSNPFRDPTNFSNAPSKIWKVH